MIFLPPAKPRADSDAQSVSARRPRAASQVTDWGAATAALTKQGAIINDGFGRTLDAHRRDRGAPAHQISSLALGCPLVALCVFLFMTCFFAL